MSIVRQPCNMTHIEELTRPIIIITTIIINNIIIRPCLTSLIGVEPPLVPPVVVLPVTCVSTPPTAAGVRYAHPGHHGRVNLHDPLKVIL